VAPGAAGLVGGGLSLSGSRADGHVDAQCFELAEMAADLTVAACLLVVPAGAEVGKPGRGVSQQGA